jgi:hypothetical protein
VNGYGNFAALFRFGNGVTYACAFPTEERRREVCESAHTGNGDPAKWKVRASDGSYQKLAAALWIETFDVVERRTAAKAPRPTLVPAGASA